MKYSIHPNYLLHRLNIPGKIPKPNLGINADTDNYTIYGLITTQLSVPLQRQFSFIFRNYDDFKVSKFHTCEPQS